MAISLVGASIIWRFVYDYHDKSQTQIGIANAVIKGLGFDTYKFILNDPWNTIFLIIVMIWVQAGFAMVILSASIKAIPDDIVEAARLDGVGGFRMFRYITVPSIRPSLIVVLTTISITTLKAFDIVRTMTGGNFDTSVLAYQFYREKGVEAVVAQEPVTATAKRALSSPWASLAAIIIAVLWTIPTSACW